LNEYKTSVIIFFAYISLENYYKDASVLTKCTNAVTILFIGQKNFFISRVHGTVFIHVITPIFKYTKTINKYSEK